MKTPTEKLLLLALFVVTAALFAKTGSAANQENPMAALTAAAQTMPGPYQASCTVLQWDGAVHANCQVIDTRTGKLSRSWTYSY
jgi:hypothetical protein